MEPTLNDKLRVVAKYVTGRKIIISTPLTMGRKRYAPAQYENYYYTTDVSKLKYHYHIAALWPVAGRVVQDLNKLQEEIAVKLSNEPFANPDSALQVHYDRIEAKLAAIHRNNNTFDPLQLFKSVYSAIILLNQHNDNL